MIFNWASLDNIPVHVKEYASGVYKPMSDISRYLLNRLSNCSSTLCYAYFTSRLYLTPNNVPDSRFNLLTVHCLLYTFRSNDVR